MSDGVIIEEGVLSYRREMKIRSLSSDNRTALRRAYSVWSTRTAFLGEFNMWHYIDVKNNGKRCEGSVNEK